MRALAVLMLLAVSAASAAPVPKELRRQSVAGIWEITGMMIGDTKTVDSHGQRWYFAVDGGFKNHGYPSGRYVVQPNGIDFWFGNAPALWPALTELDGDTLKVAFPKNQAVRATDFVPANNNVVYTFRRVKE